MATTKVIIRKKRINDKGMTPIFIRYTHHEVSILISVGQMISPEHWDDAGMVKRTVRGYSNINALIEKRKRVIDDIRIELQLVDIDPTIERVKDAYQKKYKKGVYAVKVSQYVLDHWDAFVAYQVNIKEIADGTARQYRAAKSRIQLFEKENKVKFRLAFTFEKYNTPLAMSRKYKNSDQDKLYFVTFTVVQWLDVFSRRHYRDIFLNSLRYCQKNKGLEICAYCIMTSHIHVIIGRHGEAALEGIIRDIKKYTSVKIIEATSDNPQKSRKELLLWHFERAGSHNSNNSKYQIWQQHSHPVDSYGEDWIHFRHKSRHR